MSHRLGSWTPPDDAATVLALAGAGIVAALLDSGYKKK